MIGVTTSRISDKLRDKFSISRFRWKVHNGKIEIIYFICNSYIIHSKLHNIIKIKPLHMKSRTSEAISDNPLMA
jgi:hypothetical protein